MQTQNIKYLLAIVFSSWFVASTAQALQPLMSTSSIAAGYYHTCALTRAGAVQCWGYNAFGQLGDDSTVQRLTPAAVSGLSNGISAIAAGYYHTCALTSAGAVQCWGYNGDGQLGDNTAYNDRLRPVAVSGLSSGVTAIAAGDGHTCALTTAGAVKCWGSDGDGQLGDNSTGDVHLLRLTPVAVSGLSSGVTAIAAGGFHTCALTSVGAVKCWGFDGFGQLGDNSTVNKLTPVAVSGLSSGVTAIAAGQYHTCVLTSAGGVQCWGYNNYGQLGDNSTVNKLTPVAVSGLSSGVTAIAAGGFHTCAITSVGEVQCWGYNNYGQLGDNSTVNKLTPVTVSSLSSGVMAIAAGQYHTCAITSVGGVQCWGYNHYGQLGDNSGFDKYTPVDVVFKSTQNGFDGDGKSDVLFLNTTTGATQYWKAAAIANKVHPGIYDNVNYSYAGSGDFNGDGKADLLFVKSSNNATLIWNGAAKSSASYPGTITTGFSVAAICDINGNGKDDIVWFNAATGKTQIWPAATKANVTYPGIQATGYVVAACGDFDGDGHADLFWHNASSGANEIWLSANKTTKLYPGANSDLTMTIVGAGDVDGDGKSDLVWYKPSNGAIRIWEGGLKSAASYPGTKDVTFTPKAIGDYDGDGKADLLWSNDTTLATQVWPAFIKGSAFNPGTYPSGFSIQK